jgi:hypothetical protein
MVVAPRFNVEKGFADAVDVAPNPPMPANGLAVVVAVPNGFGAMLVAPRAVPCVFGAFPNIPLPPCSVVAVLENGFGFAVEAVPKTVC